MTNNEIKYYNSLMTYWGQKGIKQNNMETKKKINWQAVWIIIKNILIALLTANALEQRL